MENSVTENISEGTGRKCKWQISEEVIPSGHKFFCGPATNYFDNCLHRIKKQSERIMKLLTNTWLTDGL